MTVHPSMPRMLSVTPCAATSVMEPMQAEKESATDDKSPFGLAHAVAADFTAAHNGLEQDDLSIICIKKITT